MGRERVVSDMVASVISAPPHIKTCTVCVRVA
jgi:hypothetical protein